MGWKAGDIPDLSGRVAVVTGGHSGLGLETSRRLAARGARVVIGARDLSGAEAARRLIEAETTEAQVEILSLDLGSLASVAAFARAVRAAHPAVRMLFNNAGLMGVPEGRTEDGFETQVGTNHLGHFALTLGLLPALVAGASGAGESRVISTTSTARFQAGKFDLDDLQLRGHYRPWVAYGISKRANLEFALELDRRLRHLGVRGFAADPGFSKTGLQQKSVRAIGDLEAQAAAVAVRIIGQSAAKGALSLLRAGTDPTLQGGTLVAPRWISFGAPVVRGVRGRMADPAEHAALWELSERETGMTLASVLGQA